MDNNEKKLPPTAENDVAIAAALRAEADAIEATISTKGVASQALAPGKAFAVAWLRDRADARVIPPGVPEDGDTGALTDEDDAPETCTREDMARAWDEGYERRAASLGMDPDPNPYRVIPPGVPDE